MTISLKLWNGAKNNQSLFWKNTLIMEPNGSELAWKWKGGPKITSKINSMV